MTVIHVGDPHDPQDAKNERNESIFGIWDLSNIEVLPVESLETRSMVVDSWMESMSTNRGVSEDRKESTGKRNASMSSINRYGSTRRNRHQI